MSLFDTFDNGLGNYVGSATAPGEAEHLSTIGNPAAGCAKLKSAFINPTYSQSSILNTTDNYVLASNSMHLYFNGRVQSNIDLSMQFTDLLFYVAVDFSDAPTPVEMTYVAGSLLPGGFDSGWLQFDIGLTGHTIGDTITGITFTALSSLGAGSIDTQEITIYIDNVSVGTSAPSFDAAAEQDLGLGLTRSAGGISGAIAS